MAKQVTLTINFQVDNGTSDADIVEWIEYNTGQRCFIADNNDLIKRDFNDLEDTFDSTFKLNIDNRQIKM